MLAGLVQAPSAYDPIDHLSTGRLRQRHVLNRLVATKVLSVAQADGAFAAPWACTDPLKTSVGQRVTDCRKLSTTGTAAVAPNPAFSTTTASATLPRKAANQASVGGFFPLPCSAVPVLP